MQIIQHAKEGLFNLYQAKLRSTLALLGILVGTASVVAMVLGGEIATNEALREFKSLGTDLLAVSINMSNDETASLNGKPENLTLNQALNLKTSDQSILSIAPYTQVYQPILYQGESINGIVLGVTDSFFDIVKVEIQSGRSISILDSYQFYCVVGKEIYNAIKKMTLEDPIGKPLQIGKNIFVIVGVAKSWPENSFVYANVDYSVLVPVLATTAISKYAALSNIIIKLKPNADINGVQARLSERINQLLSGKQLNFRSAKELIIKMQKQSDIFTIFLGLIGSISLLVGGIGVMNIMLVSVVERKREIGIRMAVGATRKDIGMLFLLEAVMLSVLGGVVGVVLGILVAYIIAKFSHWQFTLFLLPPLVGFLVSALVGIFFGFYPAHKASQLDPIEALRAE